MVNLHDTTFVAALYAYNFVTLFHVLNVVSCYLSCWVQKRRQKIILNRSFCEDSYLDRDTSGISLTYDRMEVSVILANVVFCLLGVTHALTPSGKSMPGSGYGLCIALKL